MKKNQPPHTMNLIKFEREQKVVRSIKLIQKAQYTLSLQEQRFLLYCISKVRPEDKETQRYTIHIRDYLNVCGLAEETSYDTVKKSVIKTLQKMILAFEYVDTKGKTKFMVTNWFDHITITREDGTVEFQFSSTVASELIGLAQYNQQADNESKLYYISDELKYMLPFRSRYSYYLYPLLRSYQNRNEWSFPIDELREKLDVFERLDDVGEYREIYEGADRSRRQPLYPRFPDFRRGVLDPAVDDINRFSNIKVAYRVERNGRNVEAITFIFEDKNRHEKVQSEMRGSLLLDRRDEYVVMIASSVPDPEDPLRFTETIRTGHDTQPQSITVAKREDRELRTLADVREHLKESTELIQEANRKRERGIGGGKRTSHANRNAEGKRTNPYFDTDHYFPVVPLGQNHFALKTNRKNLTGYAALIGGEFQEWAAQTTMEAAKEFLVFCVRTRGSARLKKYNTEGRLIYLSAAEELTVEMKGLTLQGDFSRLLHKVFNEKRTLIEAFDEWKRDFYPPIKAKKYHKNDIF